jgi:hypothetical protein
MSESSAFELAYHIYRGRRTPVLFLVWKEAPIKTTLIRELQDLCDVTYLEFGHVDELRAGIQEFFSRLPPPAASYQGKQSGRPVRRRCINDDSQTSYARSIECSTISASNASSPGFSPS